MTEKFILVVEKWQIRPEPKWVFHSERQVNGRTTAKRVLITEGLDKGKMFDRNTGKQICRRDGFALYRHSIRYCEIQP